LYASQQALAASERRFRDVAEAATDWIWEADAELRLTYLSTRFEALSGYAANAWLGQPLGELMQCPGGLEAWLEACNSGAAIRHSRQCHYRARDGELHTCHLSLLRIADGQAAGRLGHSRNTGHGNRNRKGGVVGPAASDRMR
ncbi:MAG: PAS domain S-box protein, partial [Ferrovibrio sp.]